MDVVEITVIFRKFKDGEVIAVFPYETHRVGWAMSYMHVGQHSDCNLGIIRGTTLASPEEYDDLLKELRNRYNEIPPTEEPLYKFKIMKRVHWGNHLKAVMNHKNRDRCLPMG